MAIELQWIDPAQTVLLQHFTGTWTLDDFREAHTQTLALLDEGSHPVILLGYLDTDSHYGGGNLDLRSMIEQGQAVHNRRVAGIVAVNVPTGLKVLAHLYNSVFAPHERRVVLVDAYEEGLAEAMSILAQTI